MTGAEMVTYFDLLTDKLGSGYFIEAEKYNFLTQGALEYIKRTLPSNEEGVVNLEIDQTVFNNIETLVFETGNLTTTTGSLSTTAIQSALNTASGSTEPYMYVMNVSWLPLGSSQSPLPVKYTSHNEWYDFAHNSFKRGSATQPRYKILATNFQFAPIDDTASIKLTLLKTPKTISSLVDCDLPTATHKTVVEMAVGIASTSLRDIDLNQLNNAN